MFKKIIQYALWVFISGMLIACADLEPPPKEELAEIPAETETAPSTEPTTIPTATLVPTETPVDYEAIFEPADCAFELRTVEEVNCGYLIVPEDRQQPDQTIRVHVAVVTSRSSNPAKDPLVYLNGGPGGHTLVATDLFISQFTDIVNDRDLILLDLRGVGFSEPNIDCHETTDVLLANIEKPLSVDEERSHYLDATKQCYERHLAAGINLSAYHSKAMVDDLDDLREALGYESWNLYGISYGSRVALTALREYGDSGSIRSVILDSPYTPEADFVGDFYRVFDRSFDLLFERCRLNDICNEEYPDLEARFYALVDQLNEEPITVVVSDRVNNQVLRVPFNGNDLVNHVFLELYLPSSILSLPRTIARLERGGTSDIAERMGLDIVLNEFSSFGLTNSVICVEEFPFEKETGHSGDDGEGVADQVLNVANGASQIWRDTCEVWQVDAAEELIENEPVFSSIPTLLLSGDYDPITPPDYATQAAWYLVNSNHFIFEGQSHGVFGITKCSEVIVGQFLEEPMNRPDDSCLEDMFWGFAPP
ncbi:MAG: alpha/beta fold hydrolase [Chloroflexota bacterium]